MIAVWASCVRYGILLLETLYLLCYDVGIIHALLNSFWLNNSSLCLLFGKTELSHQFLFSNLEFLLSIVVEFSTQTRDDTVTQIRKLQLLYTGVVAEVSLILGDVEFLDTYLSMRADLLAFYCLFPQNMWINLP